MKRFVLLTLATLLSSPAFAIHAYRSMDCTSTSHQLHYKGNYPVGGDYGLTRIAERESSEVLALPNEPEIYDEASLNAAGVVFSETSSRNLGPVQRAEECSFDHEEWRSEKIIRIERISADAAKLLGLRQGESLTFQCSESTDTPNGNSCDF